MELSLCNCDLNEARLVLVLLNILVTIHLPRTQSENQK